MSSSVLRDNLRLERSCLRSGSVQRLGINRLWHAEGDQITGECIYRRFSADRSKEEQLGPKMSSFSSESEHLLKSPSLLQL